MPEPEALSNGAPIPPPDCDLRDFKFMPLDVARFRDSKFAAKVSDAAFRAGVMLWAAAWHQVPASSLPDDDVELASLAGFGRVVEAWKAVREDALHGFERHADGRLYHPVIAEKAIEAWALKRTQSRRGKNGAAARWGKGENASSIENGCSKHNEAMADAPKTDACAKKKHSNRQGQGHRQGEGRIPFGDIKTNFLIGDGWALDAEALAIAAEAGLSETEARAAADQHLAWWRANQPEARKPRAGWAMAWRNRCERIADDPAERKRLGRTPGARAGFAPLGVAPPPSAGPAWWIKAGAALHAADALAWSTWWARATPRDEPGALVAHSEAAARRINANDAGLDAKALTGLSFRALDPEEARIEALAAAGETSRADMARQARAARVSA